MGCQSELLFSYSLGRGIATNVQELKFERNLTSLVELKIDLIFDLIL